MIPDEAVEAAARVHFERNGGRWDEWSADEKSSETDDMQAALAAADAVMFSDEAIERAAEALYMTSSGSSEKHWDDIGRLRQEYFRSRVRAVVTALKGDA